MKKSELRKIIKEEIQKLLESDSFDTSNVIKINLKRFLSELDSLDISYTQEGNELFIDETELSQSMQIRMQKIGMG